MKKIKELTTFLLNLNLVAAENIESFVDEPKIVPAGKRISGDSIVIYRQHYTATFYIERYPYKEHSAELIFSHVCAWLMDNDSDRQEIAQPDVDVEILDAYTANIEISIDFEEDVHAIEDPAGPVTLNGKQYRILDSDIYYAEEGTVKT